MLLISPEESPSPDWQRDGEPLPRSHLRWIGGCSGGRAARALVDSAADTAAATENENRSHRQRLNNSAVRTLSSQRAPGSRIHCLHIGSELLF
jgi:hypothetical protein